MRLIYARCTHTADGTHFATLMESSENWKRVATLLLRTSRSRKRKKASKDIPVREKSMLEEGKFAAFENIFLPSEHSVPRFSAKSFCERGYFFDIA